MKKVLCVLLSLVMMLSMLAGLGFNAYAEDKVEDEVEEVEMVDLYFGSDVTNADEDINFLYLVIVNDEAYDGVALSDSGEKYVIEGGLVYLPTTEVVRISVPLGSSYLVVRDELFTETDEYITIEYEEMEGVAIPDSTYYEISGSTQHGDIDIGDSTINSNKKEITEEEFNAATDNGKNLTVPYYFYYKDSTHNNLQKRRTASEVEFCQPITVNSSNIYRLKTEKQNMKVTDITVTSECKKTTILGRTNYSITGSATARVNSEKLEQSVPYATVVSQTFAQAQEKAVTNSKASLRTAVTSVANQLFTDEAKSVGSTVNIDALITAPLFKESNNGGNIVKTTLNLFEFSPYIAVNYKYEKVDDPTSIRAVFGGDIHKHNYIPYVIAPTCETQGYTLHKCRCGLGYSDTYVSELGHELIELDAIEPTCAEYGYESGVGCSRCDAIFVGREQIDKLPHTPVTDPAVEPTCAKTGLTEGTHCEVCGEIIDAQQVVEMLPHTPVKDAAVAPSCSKAGLTEGTHCEVCGAVITAQKSVAKLAHTPATTVTKASPGKDGKIVTTCSVCKAVISEKTIAAPKTFTLSAKSFEYNGKAKKPTVTVKDNNGKVIESSNYTLGYSKNKKVGKASVKITFKGNYTGTKTVNFAINPKNTSISKLTAGKKAFTVKWKKQTKETTGYQIQYSTSSKFKKAKTVTITKNKTTSKKITKLSANKKYYVRIRTYKKVGKDTFYSTWSKAKTIKTNK